MQTQIPSRYTFERLLTELEEISTCDELTGLVWMSMMPSSDRKAMAVMAAEVRGELVASMLITPMQPEQFEASCARVATQLFGRCGITLQSLNAFLSTLKLHQLYGSSIESR